MDLSVIIPVYNEEGIIEKSSRSVIAYFSSLPLSWELIVVNDGSTDGTKEWLEKFRPEFPEIILIHFARNHGKGAAVCEGFSRSRGDYMLFFDIDLSTPLSTFQKFWVQRHERTLLVGSRVAPGAAIVKHQPVLKEWAGQSSNVLVRALFPISCRDTQCGFKFYPAGFRVLLPLSRITRAGFDIEWLIIALRNGFEIREIPVTWRNRDGSRFTFIDYPRTLYDLMCVKMNDMRGMYRTI